MAQVIPQYNFGEQLGKDLGSSLSQGLQQLAQIKMQHLMQRHQQVQVAEGLKSLMPNTSSEERMQIAGLPEPVLKEWVHRKMLEPQEQRTAQAWSDIASGRQTQPMNAPQVGVEQPLIQPTNQQPNMQQPREFNIPKGVDPRAAGEMAKTFQVERLAQEKISATKEAQLEKIYAGKSKDYTALSNRVIAADRQIQEYNQMIEAAETGELVAGPLRAALETHDGQDIFTNPLTALTEKNVQNAFNEEFKNLKLGGKPSEFIFKTMAKGWPSLRQYPEAMSIVAYLKKADVQIGKLIDQKEIDLTNKYYKQRKYSPPNIRNQATQLSKKETSQIMQDAKRYYDNGVFNILMKSKGDTAQGFTGRAFENIETAKKEMAPGHFIHDESTGIVWGKGKNGEVYQARYIGGQYKKGG